MSIDAACRDWSALLGPEAVVRDREQLRRAARSTQPQLPAMAAIVRVLQRSQLPDVLRVARRHGVPVYRVSRGRNWGFTDGCPASPGQVQLDLSGLDRIIAVDEQLGYAVIESGVTQGQLIAELARRGSRWVVESTGGAGPDTSIVGNVLERGLAVSQIPERAAAVSGLEVVLADGRVIRTGFRAIPGSHVDHVLRWGLGPSLDGLFSQSNLGVVTELGIHLVPRPQVRRLLFVSAPDAGLETLVDRLARLRQSGGLPNLVSLFAVAAPPRGAWMGMSAVTGGARVVAALSADAEDALKSVGSVAWMQADEPSPEHAVTHVRNRLGLPASPFVDALLGLVATLQSGTAITLPPEALLAYAGGPDVQRPDHPPQSSDPTAEDYGLTFFWPTCPLRGADVRRLLDLMTPLLTAAGFPRLFNVRMISARAPSSSPGSCTTARTPDDRHEPRGRPRQGRRRDRDRALPATERAAATGVSEEPRSGSARRQKADTTKGRNAHG